MGPLQSLLGMMPGFAGQQLKNMKVDERELDRVQAIILSMTPEERRRPELIKGSRRLRIAKGSGTNVQAVNQLVKQFGQMRKVMKQIGQGKMPDLQAHDAPGLANLPRRFSDAFQYRRKDFHGSSTPTHPRGRARRTRSGASSPPISARPRDGRIIEIARASTTPRPSPRRSRVDEERVRDWLATGAQPTQQVRKLLRTQGIDARTC